MSIRVLYIAMFCQDPKINLENLRNRIIYLYTHHFISHNTTIIIFYLNTCHTIVKKFHTLKLYFKFKKTKENKVKFTSR